MFSKKELDPAAASPIPVLTYRGRLGTCTLLRKVCDAVQAGEPRAATAVDWTDEI